MRLASLIAIALVATSALGEELVPPPAPPPISARLVTPTWSLGAGLSFFSPVFSAGLLGGTGGLAGLGTLASTPVTPSVSVERVFSPQFALGLGFEGSIQSVSAAQTASSPTGTIGIGLSPRFIMTNADAPVSFTLFSTVSAGYSASGPGSVSLGTGTAGFLSSGALAVGLGSGVAFELRLLERLSVRVQANLVRLSVASLTTRFSAGGPVTEQNQVLVGASFLPSPSIELRLYL